MKPSGKLSLKLLCYVTYNIFISISEKIPHDSVTATSQCSQLAHAHLRLQIIYQGYIKTLRVTLLLNLKSFQRRRNPQKNLFLSLRREFRKLFISIFKGICRILKSSEQAYLLHSRKLSQNNFLFSFEEIFHDFKIIYRVSAFNYKFQNWRYLPFKSFSNIPAILLKLPRPSGLFPKASRNVYI